MIDQLKSRNDASSYRHRTDKLTSYIEQKKESSRNRRQIISRMTETRNNSEYNGKESIVECRDEASNINKTGRDHADLCTGRDDVENSNSSASETSPPIHTSSFSVNDLPISRRLAHASRHSRLKASRRSSNESMTSPYLTNLSKPREESKSNSSEEPSKLVNASRYSRLKTARRSSNERNSGSYLTNLSKAREESKSNSSEEPSNSISVNGSKISAENKSSAGSKSSGEKSSGYKQVRFSDYNVEKKIIYKNEEHKLSKHQSMKTLTSKGLKEEVSNKTKGVDLGVAPVMAMISNILFGPEKQEPKHIGITIEYDKDDETVQSEITFIHNDRRAR